MFINNEPARRQVYLHRLRRWLCETSFDIYAVDSSGETLPIQHPRLKQFAFQQSKDASTSSTVAESASILKACAYFMEDFQKYDLIFKVTGKYFLPSFEHVTLSIPSDAQVVFQNRFDFLHQNTEITGYSPYLLYYLTKNIHGDEIYERQMKRVGDNPLIKVYRLPRMKLQDFTSRGNGDVLDSL